MKCNRLLETAACLCLTMPLGLWTQSAGAQTAAAARQLVTAPLAETRMVSLPGNVRPEANAANDRGLVSNSLPMDHMLLLVRRPADREAALASLLERQYKAGDPDFHRWLTPDELGQKYGPNPSDVAAVTTWLEVSRL